MTARTITADTPMTTTTTKVDRVDTKPDNAGMMAGADMYRRMQTKQKGSSKNGYLMAGVAAVAVIAAGAYFATHQNHSGGMPYGQTPGAVAATNATNASQQAQSSAQSAQESARQATENAQAKAEATEAKTVASTGNPPAAVTDKPVKTPVHTVAHRAARDEQPVVRHVASHQSPAEANDAAQAAINTSAVTAPPPPVTATAPAPVAATPAPAPTTAAPAPAPVEQPAPTTPSPQ